MESGEKVFLLRFFDLKRDPFSNAPEDEFFYTNAAIRQVYRELINALAERPGIAALTSEAGTGKTILLGRLCSELRAAGHLVIARYRAGLSFNELVTVIAEEMQVPSGSAGEVEFLRRLHEQLERNKGARPPVLIIDDAERLGGNVIMNLGRLLAGPADRSLRVLLCGLPELAKRLELPVLAELRRMLSVSCRLDRLDDNDAASYIFHRLRRADYHGTTLFSSAAINTVVATAAGLPRRINWLCQQSLIVAAAAGRPVITSEIVEEAATQLMPKNASPIEAGHDPASVGRNRAAIAGTMGAGILAAGIVLYSLTGLHVTAPSREGTAIPLEGSAVPSEGRSGSAEPVRLRLEEAPQLEQAVQWAFDEPGALPAERLPRPATPEAASANLPQPVGPCLEARPESGSQGRCSNSSDSTEHGNTANGGPITPANERPDESRGAVKSVSGAEPTAPVEQRSPASALIARAQSQLEAGHIADPTGDNAVETYRQLFAVGAEPAQESKLVEQIRLALWVSARNALRAGKWAEARRFYELAVHPAIDIEDAEPLAKAATQDIDTEVAAAPEPVLSRDAAQGAGASDSSDPSAPPEMSKTESLDRPMPGQALGREQAVDGEPRSAAPPQASDDVAAVPTTGTAEPAQATDTGKSDGAIPNVGNEGSTAPIAGGSAQQAQSDDAEKSGTSTPPEASPQNSVAPAVVPAVMMPAASPMPAETIAALFKRGEELLRIGDISAARLAYERAAAGGSARAMTALGMTYDASFLSRINVRGIRPDPAMAAEWYRKAATLGDAAAAPQPPAAPVSKPVAEPKAKLAPELAGKPAEKPAPPANRPQLARAVPPSKTGVRNAEVPENRPLPTAAAPTAQPPSAPPPVTAATVTSAGASRVHGPTNLLPPSTRASASTAGEAPPER